MVSFSSGGLLHPIHMDLRAGRDGGRLRGKVSIATCSRDDHCGCGMISKQMQAWLSNHSQPVGSPQIVPICERLTVLRNVTHWIYRMLFHTASVWSLCIIWTHLKRLKL